MVWKNPFLIRHAEKIISDAEFLQLFSSEALASVNEGSFNTIRYVESTPGAGKTTLFKALQPGVLSYLKENNESVRDFYNRAVKYGIIDQSGVKLLSCIISCAKNYDLIDSVFQNGRKQQVLFALLNARITILLLKNMMTIFELETTEDLVEISFSEYPDEFDMLSEPIINGYDLYRWAQDEERKICQYLDRLSDETTNFTFYYEDLFLLKLFEPHNIRFKNEETFNFTLIILDDVQKLTSGQRDLIIKTLYTMRPNLGIWIGERIEALSNYEIMSSDATKRREYDVVQLDEFYRNMKGGYGKLLSAIADKRVNLQSSNSIKTFDNCLDNRPNYKEYESKLRLFVDEAKEKIYADKHFGDKYIGFVDSIIDSDLSIFDKAHKFAVLLIDYNRERASRQTRLLPSDYDTDEFQESFEDNSYVANYYLCTKLGIPYYYGKDKLIDISSYNIEQFLAFAGEIYAISISKIIIGTRASRFALNPHEQQKAIKNVAAARYDEITKKFNCGEQIKNLLRNLCQKSLIMRDEWKNSYNGGTVTGFGILKNQLPQLMSNDGNKGLLNVLSVAVSANYFEKRLINQGGQEWIVFYYNRWVCVHYDLPLRYGGWFRSSIDELNSFIYEADYYLKKETPTTFKQQRLLNHDD